MSAGDARTPSTALRRLLIAYLAAGALLYAAIGLAGLLAPRWLMGLVDVRLETPLALNEIRAAYGGQMLALAAAMGVGLARPALRRAALALFVASAGAFAAARVVSVVVDGAPGAAAWVLLGAEGSGLVAGLALLAALRRPPRGPR